MFQCNEETCKIRNDCIMHVQQCMPEWYGALDVPELRLYFVKEDQTIDLNT